MKGKGLTLYAVAHFWVDFSCALLLFGQVATQESALSLFLLYNFFAFAVQMPLGLLADRLGGEKYFAALGCALVALAWAFGGLPAALLAGLGNALFHVGGGVYTLNSFRGCGPLGVFVSTGAPGIYLGALATVQAAFPGPVICLGLLALGAAILRWGSGEKALDFTPIPVGGARSALPLLALFAVVVLRSALGGLFQFPWKGPLGLWLALAVAGGKAAGGLLADTFGRRRTAFVSLGLAALCFLWSDFSAPGLLAVFAFNMTMALTLRGAADFLRGTKGFAFGLLTFALFLGTLPVLLGYPLAQGSGILYAAGAVSSLLLLNLGLREEKEVP